MIGSTVVRNLDPGADEQARARELRRHYVYTMDMLASRTPAQIRASNEALIGRELGQLKEIEAYKRVLDRAGIPRDPPADWEPKNPEQLMTGLERETYYKRRAALAREKLLPDPTLAPPQ